jgi:hypothetical protein
MMVNRSRGVLLMRHVLRTGCGHDSAWARGVLVWHSSQKSVLGYILLRWGYASRSLKLWGWICTKIPGVFEMYVPILISLTRTYSRPVVQYLYITARCPVHFHDPVSRTYLTRPVVPYLFCDPVSRTYFFYSFPNSFADIIQPSSVTFGDVQSSSTSWSMAESSRNLPKVL